MSKPFPATVGVCPFCKKDKFHKLEGYHFMGWKQFQCEYCYAKFAKPEAMQIYTSRHDEYHTNNDNPKGGSIFDSFTHPFKKQDNRGNKKKRIGLI